MKRPLRGCIGCGGPCTLDCVDNFGNPYKGCPRCRLLSQAEIDALAKLPPRRGHQVSDKREDG